MRVGRTGGVCAVGLIACLVLASCTFGDFTEDAGIDDATAIDAAGPVVDAGLDGGRPADAADPVDAGGPDATVFDAGPHPIGPLEDGLTTLVGDSKAGLLNGSREFSLFSNPVNVLVGPGGDIFVADFENDAIRRVTPTGDTTTLVRQPGFSRPFGMAFTPSGVFYVETDRSSVGADTGALWQVSLTTGVATLVLDNAGRLRAMDSLSDGRLVVGDAAAHTIKIYNPLGGTMTPLAGLAGAAGFADGLGGAARFDLMRDLVVTSTDEIYVADSSNHRVRHVTLAGVVTTVAGNGIAASTDGPALTSSLRRPSGLALDGNDILYISEFGSGLLRQLSGGTLSTIAGTTPGFSDNFDPLHGKLFACEGLDFRAPHLFVADGNGGEPRPFHRIRRVTIEAAVD